ncbi:MAG: hypothetical protein HKP24_06505 [Croceitalea sp.]|nr:hypothetical protein [Croceitalea sp.]NNM18206.1 hypothetical protein [Croceitalea sp.]
MKKLIIPFLVIVTLVSCTQDSSTDPQVNLQSTLINDEGAKANVCHKGKQIIVSVNALAAHQKHGDAIDFDGDGYYDQENTCSELIDADDTDPNVTELNSSWSGDFLLLQPNDMLEDVGFDISIELASDLLSGSFEVSGPLNCSGDLNFINNTDNVYFYEYTGCSSILAGCQFSIDFLIDGSIDVLVDCDSEIDYTGNLSPN